MSPPTNADIIPGRTSDDLVMEGESSEDEGDHAPKNIVSDPRDGYLLDVAMLPHVLKVTVAACKPNILAMWEVLKMITVAIMPNRNACCSLYKLSIWARGHMWPLTENAFFICIFWHDVVPLPRIVNLQGHLDSMQKVLLKSVVV
jgi:hypothetical protein